MKECPYPTLTIEGHAWLEGYNAAKYERIEELQARQAIIDAETPIDPATGTGGFLVKEKPHVEDL